MEAFHRMNFMTELNSFLFGFVFPQTILFVENCRDFVFGIFCEGHFLNTIMRFVRCDDEKSKKFGT